MLASLLLPLLRECFPGRGLVESGPPGAVAVFPGLHLGIRGVSIFDDGHELTLSVDEHTHSHFAECDEVLDFLSELFADRVAVWSVPNVGGGWHRIDLADSGAPAGVPEFVWSGPLSRSPARCES